MFLRVEGNTGILFLEVTADVIVEEPIVSSGGLLGLRYDDHLLDEEEIALIFGAHILDIQ